MRKILYFDKEINIEDFVRAELPKNGGAQNVCFKDNLIVLCTAIGIDEAACDRMKKRELLDMLLDNGKTYEELAKKFGVGVSSQVYQKTFGITHQEIKKLEKEKLLSVVGEYRFRAYGKYKYAPLYCVYEYANMTDEDMKILLSKI